MIRFIALSGKLPLSIWRDKTLLKAEKYADYGTGVFYLMEIARNSQSSVIGIVSDDDEKKTTVVELGTVEEGRFQITLARHDILVTCNFFPAKNKNTPITPDTFSLYLSRLNITYGIKWDNIDAAIRTCNLDQEPSYNVVIAEGDYPQNEISEYYELNPALKNARLSGDADEQIDYKNITPFVIVKKDQPLAILRRHVTGLDGHDVHDALVPYRIIDRQGYAAGTNTRLEGDYIVANLHGQLVESKRTLAVQETLAINGPVGYKTGHISFPGDIVIGGPVSDGFRIYAGKSLTIKQTFDVTETITREDLTVTGGIIGRGQALVKVGGVIKTRFIDNCRVACRRTVIVIKEIVNSQVFALGTVDLGDKGVILGSKIYSLHGVRAKAIGRKGAKAASIHCGVDFTIMQDKTRSTTALKDNALKLNRYRNLFEALDDEPKEAEKRRKLEEIIAALEAEQKEISAHISDLMTKINSDEKAVVEISGEIVPGTIIEICQVSMVVDEPLRKVRIRLDRAANRLVTEKIER
ncbi:MAG: FapA family protein [Spirochaetaceae bacterium]|jgi:uncharacterized protein (DUF342 family)|nr:FapA family protein [Spirochaetaceae bacterium]